MPVFSAEGILNTPFSAEKIPVSKLLRHVGKSGCIFGGKIESCLFEEAEKLGLYCKDYLKREPLAIKNAALTAEGAVAIAIDEMDRAVCGEKSLIIGYGRIGKLLARKLSALGSEVTVAARSPEARAWVCADGLKPITISDLAEKLADFSLIFNTAPAKVLSDGHLMRIKKDSLLIDLASLPGGFDLVTARTLGIRSMRALSVPGKTAPYSAAKIIADEIKEMLYERVKEA